MVDYKDVEEIGLKDKIFEIQTIFSSKQGGDLLWSKDLERYYEVLRGKEYPNLGESSFLIELIEVDKGKRDVGLIDSFGKAQEIINKKDIHVGDSIIIASGYVKIQEPYEEGFEEFKGFDYLIFPSRNIKIQNIIRRKVIDTDFRSVDFGKEDKEYVKSQFKVRFNEDPEYWREYIKKIVEVDNRYWGDLLGTYYG